jgi:hypothetical protein
MRRIGRVLVVSAAIVALAAGCGDDSSSSDDTESDGTSASTELTAGGLPIAAAQLGPAQDEAGMEPFCDAWRGMEDAESIDDIPVNELEDGIEVLPDELQADTSALVEQIAEYRDLMLEFEGAGLEPGGVDPVALEELSAAIEESITALDETMGSSLPMDIFLLCADLPHPQFTPQCPGGQPSTGFAVVGELGDTTTTGESTPDPLIDAVVDAAGPEAASVLTATENPTRRDGAFDGESLWVAVLAADGTTLRVAELGDEGSGWQQGGTLSCDDADEDLQPVGTVIEVAD